FDDGRDFDPRQVALVESAADNDALVPSFPASPLPPVEEGIDWTGYSPNRIALRVAAPRDRILVLAEPCVDGWQARIDGQVVPLLRVNYFLRGLRVPAGTRIVEMTYTVPGLKNGLVVSALGVAGLALLAAWPRQAPRLTRHP
ncbi:MAG: YfhO family protein, partial [Phycisphaerae bacterium]